MTEIKDDEWYLLQILPEVVWKKVLGNLEDSNFFESASNSSPYFRKHLLSFRTTHLFGKVFRSLALRYDKQYFECYDDVADNVEVVGGRVWKYPGGYRLICRKWNQTVQLYYQYHYSHIWSMDDEVDQEWPRIGRCEGYYRWEYASEDFLDFFQEMCGQETFSSPLFQRALQVDVNSAEVGCAANVVIERFLQTYGQGIWYLDLKITNTSDTLVEFYFALKDLLELMPNLRVLRLWYIKGRRQSWYAKRLLRKAIKICPLNTFPNLVFMEILQNLPVPILNELLVKNTHVYKLDILAAGHNILSLHFPNLMELYVNIRSQFELHRFRSKGKAWKLQAFRCMFSYFETEETLKQIFKMVERNWSKSLRHLYIWKRSSSTEQMRLIHATICNTLNLPLLKVFKLEIPHSVGLDFLLPTASNLEVIHIDRMSEFTKINWKKYYYYILAQHVKFLGFEENLKTSNIWNKFPKLKKVISGAGTFYRPS